MYVYRAPTVPCGHNMCICCLYVREYSNKCLEQSNVSIANINQHLRADNISILDNRQLSGPNSQFLPLKLADNVTVSLLLYIIIHKTCIQYSPNTEAKTDSE